jgi:hypothetical protein
MNGLTQLQAFCPGQIKIVQRKGSDVPAFIFSEYELHIIGQRRFAGALSSADTDKQGLFTPAFSDEPVDQGVILVPNQVMEAGRQLVTGYKFVDVVFCDHEDSELN